MKTFKNTIKDIKTDDLHQTALDIAYKQWLITNNKHWSYQDMIENTRKVYGDFHEWLVLIGKFNQQVCNGGIYQYYDNRYVGDESCDGVNEMVLHERLMELTEMYKSVIPKNYEKLYRILVDIIKIYSVDEDRYLDETCDACNGSGEGEYIEEDDEYNECEYCDGSGEVERDNEYYGCITTECDEKWEKLSDKYYTINETLMEEINEYLIKNN